MDKLEKFLAGFSISAKKQTYGNCVYVQTPKCEKLSFEIPLDQMAAKDEIEKYMKKRRKTLEVSRRGIISSSNPCYHYVVGNKKTCEDLRRAEEKDRELVEKFWQIYHQSGKAPADEFYRRTKAKYNIQSVKT